MYPFPTKDRDRLTVYIGGDKMNNNKRQIDKKLTKQVRIENEWHRYAKLEATKQGSSIKTFLEGLLAENLARQ